MVRCRRCGLVYVDRPPSRHALQQAYHAADYDSSEEAGDAAATYLRELAPVFAQVRHGHALEIGTGTGVFLGGLLNLGFDQVTGVEPSPAAIEAAADEVRPCIREGIFNRGDYADESFDLICCFMTMEHVHDPREVAEAAYALLRPGGAFAVVVHDCDACINRLLGRRSPIVDVEHMQLFSPRSVTELLRRTGYEDESVKPFANRYNASYWARLLPIPGFLKKGVLKTLAVTRLGKAKLSMNVGNLVAFGFKPQ
jgi:SAM-dependent methyltransferase